jgi:hypothetical protein
LSTKWKYFGYKPYAIEKNEVLSKADFEELPGKHQFSNLIKDFGMINRQGYNLKIIEK